MYRWQVSREGWLPGVWDNEPDFVRRARRGYRLIGLRSKANGCWQGFVGIPPGHPLYGLAREELSIYLCPHGGLQYAGPLPRFDRSSRYWFAMFEGCTDVDLQPALLRATAETLRDLCLQPENHVLPEQEYKDLDWLEYEFAEAIKTLDSYRPTPFKPRRGWLRFIS